MADDDGRGARSAAWGVVAGVFGGCAVAAWLGVPGAPAIVVVLACVLSVVAAVGLYMCFASLSGTWPAGRSLRSGAQAHQLPSAATQPALPPPPVDVIVRAEQAVMRLRLVVVNRSHRGRFSAEVVSITDADGNALPGPSSWPVPWLEDGSVEPREISFVGSRILDFARFNTGESDPWPRRAYWLFSSPEPVPVAYDPVLDKKEIAAQRFVVTVRIIRTEPSPNHMERRFSVGVTGGGALVCEPCL